MSVMVAIMSVMVGTMSLMVGTMSPMMATMRLMIAALCDTSYHQIRAKLTMIVKNAVKYLK